MFLDGMYVQVGEQHVLHGGERLPVLRVCAKRARAQLIAEHLGPAGRVVLFTCGNAARALEARGLDVLAIGDAEGLAATRWWSPAEVQRAFLGRFDATSGHLPAAMMLELGRRLRALAGDMIDPLGAYAVPTGSGETVLALRWAYPQARLVAVYDMDRATRYHPEAPLRVLVQQGEVLRVGAGGVALE